MTKGTSRLRRAVAIAVALGTIGFATQAGAVSAAVQYACMGDYFRYCSRHAVDSPGLRRCMNVNGHKLSRRCVSALVRAGEVSQAEVDRRAASSRRASRGLRARHR